MSTLPELTHQKGQVAIVICQRFPELTRKKDAPAARVSPGPATPAFAEPLDRGARESTLACPARRRGRLGWTRPVSGAGGAAWRPSLACPLAAARRLRRRFAEGEGGSVGWPRGRRQELEQRRPADRVRQAGKSRLVSRVRTLLARLGVARRGERFNAGGSSRWRDGVVSCHAWEVAGAASPLDPPGNAGRQRSSGNASIHLRGLDGTRGMGRAKPLSSSLL